MNNILGNYIFKCGSFPFINLIVEEFIHNYVLLCHIFIIEWVVQF